MIMKYGGYAAKIEPDEESGLIFGKVVDTIDTIVFHGATVPDIRKAFQESIDNYLAACKRHGREPNKPFNGKISYRTNSKIHRRLSMEAARHGLSINELVDRFVKRGMRSSGSRDRLSDVPGMDKYKDKIAQPVAEIPNAKPLKPAKIPLLQEKPEKAASQKKAKAKSN